MSSTPNTSSSTASNSAASSSPSPKSSPTVSSTPSKPTSSRPPRRGQKNAPSQKAAGSSKPDAERQERDNLISTIERMNVPPYNSQRKVARYIMELALRNPYKPNMDGNLDFMISQDEYRDGLEKYHFYLEAVTG